MSGLAALVFVILASVPAGSVAAELPKPPAVWSDFDPNRGPWNEDVVAEVTRDGVYYRDSYISAWVLGEEIRVFCKYAVKQDRRRAPGLLNVHGWMGAPNIDRTYVDEGWAVLAHDYCGATGQRKHYTRYPKPLAHANMDRKWGGSIRAHTPDRKSITDPTQTSDYVWYAIQRRVLSYLEQQKQVDASRLAAKGYSYGGTIMWNLGTDPRIKAIVAYFGIGWNEYYRSKQVWMYEVPYREPQRTPGERLYLSAIAPQAHVPYIKAATLFLNGTNDHHGGHERGLQSFKMFQAGVPWSFAQQARGHHNTEKIGQNTRFWLRKHVLGADVFWPEHPQSRIRLDQAGIPELVVTPASPDRVKNVDVYYALKSPVSFNRSWRDTTSQHGAANTWIAKLPVIDVDDYVFAFANITYDTTVVRSTDFAAAIPSKLGTAVATDAPSDVIYTGGDGVGGWSHVVEVEGPGGSKGFRSTDRRRGSGTEQLNDPKWQAPVGTRLGFRFFCTQPLKLQFRAGDHWQAVIDITAADDWQQMVVPAKMLINRHNGKPLTSWRNIGKIHFLPHARSDITRVIFSDFRWLPVAR
ncbi:MAG: prolyl oligopeptidase family serine peptidase [Planctomycetaceae bacterium]